ncbi:PREDICTED: 4F2 cell-surface antigen heavy chain [Condylura cristata]|uniref:4F2 cell-surface antigen heavy chain n=1 Tax=Condylura cristata TaxID=143302 RepID=UPI0006436220|nr:PREDICTED: 4F2 cell-surface antigen heavy chain [Condylura cristata]
MSASMDPELPESSIDVVSVPNQPSTAQSDPDVQGPSEGGDSGTMSQDAEGDLKDVELNEMEPEKQPMNAASGAAVAGGAEKNGLVIKVADDDEVAAAAKFTGLSKEELLKVAGSPGWVRTRWALLLLFWLGWLGMLAGAVVIIVQAPRCRELPAQSWWHKGALYRIGDLRAFLGGEAGNLQGLKGRLDYLSTLKVKGIVLGPIHENEDDKLSGTNLKKIDPTLGSKEDFDNFLQSSQKKSIRVVLDLTPNYRGQAMWFKPEEQNEVTAQMRDALNFWLQAGVDGFQLRNMESLMNGPSLLAEWQNITKSFNEDRLLIAGTGSANLSVIQELSQSTGLLTSSYLSAFENMRSTSSLIIQYLDAIGDGWCSWTVSQEGLMTATVSSPLLQLYHLLFFTLPGTPVFNYGDEIGLQAATGQPKKAPVMPWGESSDPSTSGSGSTNLSSVTEQSKDPGSLLSFFRKLSDQRSKERSLLHGEFHQLSLGPNIFSYIRQWDQNTRFLVLLNVGDVDQRTSLSSANLPAGISLPAEVTLVLSTNSGRKESSSVDLESLTLAPNEGLLLHFPYQA